MATEPGNDPHDLSRFVGLQFSRLPIICRWFCSCGRLISKEFDSLRFGFELYHVTTFIESDSFPPISTPGSTCR